MPPGASIQSATTFGSAPGSRRMSSSPASESVKKMRPFLSTPIDSSRPYGSQLVEVRLSDGRLLDPAATYKIVTNDFMASGGDEFTMLKQGRNITDTFIPLRDALAEAVKKAGVLNLQLDGRLKDLGKAALKPAA